MALENRRKSPIDYDIKVEKPDEFGGVLVNADMTIHDMDTDAYSKREIKSYYFSKKEVDAKISEFGKGNEQYFGRINESGERRLSGDIGNLKDEIEKRLIRYAADNLSDARIPPQTKVRLAREFFLEDDFCQKKMRDAARLTAIKERIMMLEPLEEIKLKEPMNDYFIGVVYYN